MANTRLIAALLKWQCVTRIKFFEYSGVWNKATLQEMNRLQLNKTSCQDEEQNFFKKGNTKETRDQRSCGSLHQVQGAGVGWGLKPLLVSMLYPHLFNGCFGQANSFTLFWRKATENHCFTSSWTKQCFVFLTNKNLPQQKPKVMENHYFTAPLDKATVPKNTIAISLSSGSTEYRAGLKRETQRESLVCFSLYSWCVFAWVLGHFRLAPNLVVSGRLTLFHAVKNHRGFWGPDTFLQWCTVDSDVGPSNWGWCVYKCLPQGSSPAQVHVKHAGPHTFVPGCQYSIEQTKATVNLDVSRWDSFSRQEALCVSWQELVQRQHMWRRAPCKNTGFKLSCSFLFTMLARTYLWCLNGTPFIASRYSSLEISRSPDVSARFRNFCGQKKSGSTPHETMQ